MGITVGIDLGTTFSLVAYMNPEKKLPEIVPNSDGKKLTPSVIQFLGEEIIFGSEAEKAFHAGVSGCVMSFKRDMGKSTPFYTINDKSYTAKDLSGLLLRHLKNEAEVVLGTSIDKAVITVPAYFYSIEREATVSAATEAGIEVIKIIDEPNAAALLYGLNNWRENATILVYDLGGGTFDVTLTRMVGEGNLFTITTRGDHILGGRDWDHRIEELLFKKISEEISFDVESDAKIKSIICGMSEGIKKTLSEIESTTVKIDLPRFGSVNVTINRKEFEENTKDLVERTGSLCHEVIKEAGLSVDNVSDVLLVGGSTRMPQVSKHILDIFGKNPITHVNPDEAVALGAAIQATKGNESYVSVGLKILPDGKKVTDRSDSELISNESVKPKRKISSSGLMTLRESTAHAMGIIAINQDRTKYINDIIIPSNHPRPVRVAKAFAFYTRSNDENFMDIYVLQGDKENPIDNIISYRYVVSNIRHILEKKGKTIIRVQYSYDNNGIIHVQARQEDDRFDLPIFKDVVPNDVFKYGQPIAQDVSLKPDKLNLVLAVDVSGSMYGQPLLDAKEAMINFVEQMDFSLTSVGVLVVSDWTNVVTQLTNDKSLCVRAIQSIDCGQTGFGNIAHPFDHIKEMLKGREGRLFGIVLADGVWDNQQLAVLASKACNELNIETAAIGFGSADEKFLKDISSNDANAIYVNQSELTLAFGTIAQSLGGGVSTNGKDDTVYDTETWDD